MKIIHEDTVDWEPLHIRFLLKGTPLPERCDALASFVITRMRQQETESRRAPRVAGRGR